MHMHITKAGKNSIFRNGNTNTALFHEIGNTGTKAGITSGIHNMNLSLHHSALLRVVKALSLLVIIP